MMATATNLVVKVKTEITTAASTMNKFRKLSIKSMKQIQTSVNALNKELKHMARVLEIMDKFAGKTGKRLSGNLRQASIEAKLLANNANKSARSMLALDKIARGGAGGLKRTSKSVLELSNELDDFSYRSTKSEFAFLRFVGKIRRAVYLTQFAIRGLGLGIAAMAVPIAVATRSLNKLSMATRELETWSNTLGTSTKDIQKWQFATRTLGFQADKLTDIFKDVNDKVGDFVLTGGGEAAAIFERLGVSIAQVRNKRPEEVLQFLADITSNLGKQEQVFIFEAIANDASKLLPLLKENGKELKELFGTFDRAGLGIKVEEFIKLENFRKAVSKLGAIFSSFGNKILTKIAQPFANAYDALSRFIEKTGGLETVAAGVAKGLKTAFSGLLDVMKPVVSLIDKLGTAGLAIEARKMTSIVESGQATLEKRRKMIAELEEELKAETVKTAGEDIITTRGLQLKEQIKVLIEGSVDEKNGLTIEPLRDIEAAVKQNEKVLVALNGSLDYSLNNRLTDVLYDMQAGLNKNEEVRNKIDQKNTTKQNKVINIWDKFAEIQKESEKHLKKIAENSEDGSDTKTISEQQIQILQKAMNSTGLFDRGAASDLIKAFYSQRGPSIQAQAQEIIDQFSPSIMGATQLEILDVEKQSLEELRRLNTTMPATISNAIGLLGAGIPEGVKKLGTSSFGDNKKGITGIVNKNGVYTDQQTINFNLKLTTDKEIIADNIVNSNKFKQGVVNVTVEQARNDKR